MTKPKQWRMGHTSDLMIVIRKSTHILTIIIREMGKLNMHSSIYCMNDNRKNGLNLKHTRDRTYLTSILEFQYFQIGLHNDHEVV